MNLVRRFFFPLKRYRYYISEDVNPVYSDKEIAVVGLNTARSLAIQNGSISPSQLKHMCAAFEKTGDETFKIVVSHHAFISPDRFRKIVVNAKSAVQAMDNCKVDLVLAGHLHLGHVQDARSVYASVQNQIILAQAGTTISHRLKKEPNTFNFITIDEDTITVTIRGWRESEFVEFKHHTFPRHRRITSTTLRAPEMEKELVKVKAKHG